MNQSLTPRSHFRVSARLLSGVIAGLLILGLPVSRATAASSWNPTLLVNTESFSTIDDGDSTTNIELRFGETLGEKLYYNRSESRFQLTRGLFIQGNLTATGALSIKGSMSGASLRVDHNADIWGNLTVSGSSVIDGATTINNTLKVRGAMTGSSLTVDGTTSLYGTLTTSGAVVARSTLNVTGSIAGSGGLATTGDINTRGNLKINGDNGAADAVLTFGNDSAAETLKFNDTTNQFEFSDDVSITGTLAATGNITGSGNLAIDGTFGVEGAARFGSTINVNGVTYTFPFSDGTASGKVLKTDGAGQLSWSSDIDTNTNAQTLCGANEYLDGDGNCVDVIEETELTSESDLETQLSGINVLVGTELDQFSELQAQISDAILLNQTTADNRYVNTGGDTMTGALKIINDAGITASGSILTDTNITINRLNKAQDAVLTFGNDAGAETIRFNDTTNRFEASDDFKATGNISGSSLTVDGTVNIRGVDYTFPTTNGNNGQVLTTDGEGVLTWSQSTVGTGSGGVLFLAPEYPHAVYFGSGATYIGQLSYSYDQTNKENYYHWTSTKADLQQYWISVRVRVPDNFSVWDSNQPVQLRYRTTDASSAVNYVSMRMLDTAGVPVALTGGENLAATSWTTATVTGPQAAGTFTKAGYITLLFKVATTSAGTTDLGFINLNWETTAP
ncbi:MAG: hypothetical protein PHO54_02030 [Candidatus Peribacteraceae bacterium]|nr:hypothetical protein [Candidatus Peribacteraceae bacterium]